MVNETNAVKVAILAAGTQGDIQPYVALGVGLQSRGHVVRVATYDMLKSVVIDAGLEYVPLSGDPRSLWAVFWGCGRNLYSYWRIWADNVLPRVDHFRRESVESCRGADAIIYSPPAFWGEMVGKELGIPVLRMRLAPDTPTTAFPSFFFPEIPRHTPLRRLYNLLTYYIERQVTWQAVRNSVRDPGARRKLPLWHRTPPPDDKPIYYGFSPVALPKPTDWGPSIHVTGYWFLKPPANWKPPEELVGFLSSGPRPIYFGFGSVADERPQETARIVHEALMMTGTRGVIAPGWGGIASDAQVRDNVIHINSVPHDWLFPQMAAVVHHGGAGTTAAALRSGVPSIVIPNLGDQFFWGDRVNILGVGPRLIPRKRLTVRRLVRAINEVLGSASIRHKAAELGDAIRQEDGVVRAVELIEEEIIAIRRLGSELGRTEQS